MSDPFAVIRELLDALEHEGRRVDDVRAAVDEAEAEMERLRDDLERAQDTAYHNIRYLLDELLPERDDLRTRLYEAEAEIRRLRDGEVRDYPLKDTP